MEYTNIKLALSFPPHTKQAALYFEYAIPSIWYDICEEGIPIDTIINNLIPENIFRDYLIYLNATIDPEKTKRILSEKYNIPIENVAPIQSKLYFDHIKHMLTKAGIEPFAILGYSTPINDRAKNEIGTTCISLCNLNLINTDKLSWREIIEIRKCEVSMNNLRKLRLFIFENYSDKSAEYIEDDISKRIYDYNLTVKYWKLKTVESILRISFSNEILPAIGASFGALLFGANLSTAAVTGASVYFGKVALEISERKRELDIFKSESPVAYLVNIEKKAK